MGLVNATKDNILDELNESAGQIIEEDINDSVIESLMSVYCAKVTDLARYAYDVSSDHGEGVAVRAFQQRAAETLGNGLHAFLFREQHWRTGRDIGSYLSGCLNRLAKVIRTDVDSTRKVNAPVCPACRSYGVKEFLVGEGGLLRCPICTEQVANGHEEPIRKLFSLHSRRGHRCPECEKFIPDSYVSQHFNVSCPYDDCLWFGTRQELAPMTHPLGLTCDPVVSLNAPVAPPSCSKPDSDWQDYFLSDDVDAELHIESQQRWTREVEVLKEVLEIQLKRAKRQDPEKALKRQLMHQAFCNMFDRYPEEMVSYLVHRKHSGEQPVQARIFQEFVRLVENELPFTLVKNGQQYEVESLLDPQLDLFLGVSEFETDVREGGVIPNCTNEIYIGGRKMRDFGPCFIGLLIRLDASYGVSLMHRVKCYTFSQIRTTLEPGMPVKVTHYRIPSHYEMNGLVPLQRIRRKIVDSVYQRLNGRRRRPGS